MAFQFVPPTSTHHNPRTLQGHTLASYIPLSKRLHIPTSKTAKITTHLQMTKKCSTTS